MSQEHLSVLSQMPQLTELTLHVNHPRNMEKHKSPLAVAEQAFLHIVGCGDAEHSLKSLMLEDTLQDGRLSSDWANPCGAIRRSTRTFQAKWNPTGEGKLGVVARQIRGPLGDLDRDDRYAALAQAERETRDYLDAMPTAVLAKMIEDNGAHVGHLPSDVGDSQNEVKTSGWSPKLNEYEEQWKESSGVLPLLQWQLQKRKEHGWKLWDMPLMRREAGSEGFLYDRMKEAGAEHLEESAFL